MNDVGALTYDVRVLAGVGAGSGPNLGSIVLPFTRLTPLATVKIQNYVPFV